MYNKACWFTEYNKVQAKQERGGAEAATQNANNKNQKERDITKSVFRLFNSEKKTTMGQQ